MLNSAWYISNCYDHNIAITVVILLVNGIMGVYRGYAFQVLIDRRFSSCQLAQYWHKASIQKQCFNRL